MKKEKKIFIKNPNKLSSILVAGGIILGGLSGFGIAKLSSDLNDSKENTNSDVTTKIIETTEKPIETEETIITTIKNIIEEGKTVPVETVPAETSKMSVETAPVETPKVSVVTTVEKITEAPVVTTVAETTKAPVVTTVAQTISVEPVQVASNQINNVITEKKFVEMSKLLLKEINSKVTIRGTRIVKSSGVKFELSDMYSLVYIMNIDYIDDNLKQTLIEKGYISLDFNTNVVNAFPLMEAIQADYQSKLNLNVSVDEMLCGYCYNNEDLQVNAKGYVNGEFQGDVSKEFAIYLAKYFGILTTNVDDSNGYYYDDYFFNNPNKLKSSAIAKLSDLSNNEYFEMMEKCHEKYPKISSASVAQFLDYNNFEEESFVNLGVALFDSTAQKNLNETIRLAVEGSIDNSKASKNLKNMYFWEISNKSDTTIQDCGAGFKFVNNLYVGGYINFMNYNLYKSSRAYAFDEKEYELIKKRIAYLTETVGEFNDAASVHNQCTYVKDNTKQLRK